MRLKRRGSHKQIAGAGLLLLTTLGLGSQERYANPVVFQRVHFEEATGKEVLRSKLWVMEADGSGLRQLTFGVTYDDHPSFYANQEHVLFSQFPANAYDPSGTARLIKLNIYTGQQETVGAVDGCALHHATLSPIDDLLAYHRDCGERRSQWVGFGPEAYEVSLLATNGVRTRTSIIAMHEKNPFLPPREVALVSVTGHGAGSVVRVLTDDAALHRRPAISPDERWLAWQTNTDGRGDELYLAHIDGSESQNLTKTPGNDGHPWFSRDGSWIVFESDRTGSWEIWRLDLATGVQRQLTTGGSRYSSTRPRM